MTGVKLDHQLLRCFAEKLLVAAGTAAEEAAITAEALVWTDLVGRASQGVWRLKELCPRVRDGVIRSPCAPEFTQARDGVILVNGGNGMGRFLGHLAMKKAVGIARACGLGMVAVRNSSHYGAASYYVDIAARAGMLGFAFTNAPRRVAAHGGSTPVFGTNPLAFGAPLRNGKSILVDLSTSAIAGSILRKGAETNEPIPEGVAIDAGGQPVTAPVEGPATLLPFGGAKGYCLGLMVEILAAVVTSSAMSFEIPSVLEKEHAHMSRPTGHAFLVVDIAALMSIDQYYARMETLVAAIRHSSVRPGFSEILLPGEERWRNYERQIREGIDLDANTAHSLESLAAQLTVELPW